MSCSSDLQTDADWFCNLKAVFEQAELDVFNLNHKLASCLNNITFPAIDSLSYSN